jgi:hypothetical protein
MRGTAREDLLAPPDCASCPHQAIRNYYGKAPDPAIDAFAPLPEVQGKSPWRAKQGGRLQRSDAPFVTTIERDGRIHFDDKPNVQYQPGTLGGSFDLTDLVLSGLGVELYPHRKMALMDATRAERMKMAALARTEALQHSIAMMQARLARLWRRPDLSLSQRKQLLFRLWDECAEAGNQEVVRAGEAVRAQIIGFIRKTIPPSHSSHYSAEELAQLNAERSSERAFAPYQSAAFDP